MPQAKQSFDESAEQSYDQEEEDYEYGDEEDKEYLLQEARLGKRQHSEDSEEDGRYLRGGRKRQKADENFNSSQQLHNL